MIYAYKCDCGHIEDRQSSIEDSNNQLCECGKTLWKDFSRYNIHVSVTMNKYDHALGVEVGNSREYAKVCDEKMIEPNSSKEKIIEYAAKAREKKDKARANKLRSIIDKSMSVLDSHKECVGKISAEIKNTGTSATAKKLSEVGK